MDTNRFRKFDFRSLRASAKPISEFRLDLSGLRLSDEPDGGDGNPLLPVSRDTLWQQMLERVLGRVPEGAEKAPPCNCEIAPALEDCEFAGLASLPPAVRLMDGFFPVRDQSKRGACFAFALVALCEYMLGKSVELSEQSLFHFTKLVTPGKVDDVGDGAFTLDAIHAIEEYGICPLSEWHYNPESWNYVDDPFNEGQGMALQRKLAAAQKYRFRHWRMLSRGAVLQFKQSLSAGFPVYTGVVVTDDWDNEEVHRTGIIPYSRLVWSVHVAPPPLGLVAEILAGSGIEPGSDEADAAAGKIASQLVLDTVSYVASAVFGGGATIAQASERDGGIDFILVHEGKIRGGHALCLAGYADDPSYPGGGYFIARNSWSDTEWAPESPEMPGYALIPYAYIADFAQDGVTMSEFPNADAAPSAETPLRMAATGGLRLNAFAAGAVAGAGAAASIGATRKSWLDALRRRSAADRAAVGTSPFTLPPAATAPSAPPTGIPTSTKPGFEEWLAARRSVLSKPMRDASGVLLRPGTPVLMPNPKNPGNVLCDTPENRTRMRATFETEVNAALKAAVKAEADRLLERDHNCVMPDDIRDALMNRRGIDIGKAKLRAFLLSMQQENPKRYALCINSYGNEELRLAEFIGNSRRVEE